MLNSQSGEDDKKSSLSTYCIALTSVATVYIDIVANFLTVIVVLF